MLDTRPFHRRVVPRLTRRRAERLFLPREPDDTGAATAEYAIATILRQPAPTGR